jgi:uncharacterized NAD(P)/FAD-binding protein YdhS
VRPFGEENVQRIIVVGGGAAGSAVTGELLRQGPAALDLIWLVGPRAPGRGVAYSTPAEHHLLNVRAAAMGLFGDDVGAFAAFARVRQPAVGDADFLPRAWYGDYVEAVLAREIARARQRGVRVRVLSTDATAVRGDDARGYVVTTADDERIAADGVVLAIGALPSEPLSTVSTEARASSAYAPNPWHWPEPKRAPDRVVVLGTGLTAVDAVQTAVRLWPHAQVTAVSRHGRLPQSHAATVLPAYARSAQLGDALRARPRIAMWLTLLRAAAADAADWRAVIDGLRGETKALWHVLDAAERRRFLRHLRWLWESVRHRLPPATAAELARLRLQGRLKVVAGRILSIGGAGPLVVRVRPRGTETTRTFAADLVIQATGFNLSTSSSDHRLVRQMIDDGTAQPDELDLGLAADGEGRLFACDGRPASGLRCVGTLLRGSVWECSGLPEIRALAASIATQMPAELARLAIARTHRSASGGRTHVRICDLQL